MKNILLSYALLFCCCCANAQKVDSFAVHFALKETAISKANSSYIDELISNKRIVPGQKLMLLGYADYRGTAAHNDSVSADRAMNIQDYFVSKGFSNADITQCAGKGKIDRPGMTAKEGYAPDRKVLIVIRHEATKTSIDTLKANETIALKNVLFENASDRLLASSYPELKALSDFMAQNSTAIIQIEGHICCASPDNTYNNIGLHRARAVYDFLRERGVNENRMRCIDLQASQPAVYPELTEEDRVANRRVGIRVISK